MPSGFVDADDGTGDLILGSWRAVAANDRSAMQAIPRAGSNNYALDAGETRELFQEFFNSPEGSVPWQLQHVRSCGETLS